MTDAISVNEYKRELRKSKLEESFAGQLRALFIDEGWDQSAIMREYRFHPTRRWRSDFAISRDGAMLAPDDPLRVDARVDCLIEIDGGTRQQGRHNRHEGYKNDCEKLNAAALMGYIVLRFTSDMVMDGTAVEVVRQALKGEAT